MKKVKCEYCGRPTFIDDLECFRCGAPLPLMEEQLKSVPILRGGPYTSSTTATDYNFTYYTTNNAMTNNVTGATFHGQAVVILE